MQHRVRKTVAMLGMLTAVASGVPVGARAQPSVAPPNVTLRGVVQGDVVEGQISRVDQRTRSITLDNGQEYLVPSSVVPDWNLLRAGVPVRVRYNVDGGRNLITYVEVRP